MLKPELLAERARIEKEIYESTFIDYQKERISDEVSLVEYIQDNLSDFWETSQVEDRPQINDAKVRTTFWDYEISFWEMNFEKSHDNEDRDIWSIESVEILLKKI